MDLVLHALFPHNVAMSRRPESAFELEEATSAESADLDLLQTFMYLLKICTSSVDFDHRGQPSGASEQDCFNSDDSYPQRESFVSNLITSIEVRLRVNQLRLHLKI